MMTVSDQSTFDAWVKHTQTELTTLTDAATNQDWSATTRSLEALNALMATRPDGDLAVVGALLTAARRTIDEVGRRASDERDSVLVKLRQLGTGRKALKAYA